jgi:hypothetical protein
LSSAIIIKRDFGEILSWLHRISDDVNAFAPMATKATAAVKMFDWKSMALAYERFFNNCRRMQ